MKLKVGDIIYCIKTMMRSDYEISVGGGLKVGGPLLDLGNDIWKRETFESRSGIFGSGVFLTIDKGYKVINTREFPESDICILDDDSKRWWVGQEGSSECWTIWFVSEISFIREKKINELLDVQ